MGADLSVTIIGTIMTPQSYAECLDMDLALQYRMQLMARLKENSSLIMLTVRELRQTFTNVPSQMPINAMVLKVLVLSAFLQAIREYSVQVIGIWLELAATTYLLKLCLGRKPNGTVSRGMVS